MGERLYKVKKKAHKVGGYLYAKLVKAWHEKVFSGEVDLKYLRMGPARGGTLIVVFSSCTRKGVAARYNYIRTLEDVDAPKLFILDDFGLDGRGGYYLGRDGGEEIYRTTCALIAKTKSDACATKAIYCGSSKGGWSALRFGLGDPQGTVIAGSPQYLLGDYAIEEYEIPEGNKTLLPYFSHGLYESSRITWLNSLIRREIERGSSATPVFLCYSVEEPTYDNHIRYLMDDLRAAGRVVNVREEKFSNHSDISLYFPEYLHSTIDALMASE